MVRAPTGLIASRLVELPGVAVLHTGVLMWMCGIGKALTGERRRRLRSRTSRALAPAHVPVLSFVRLSFPLVQLCLLPATPHNHQSTPAHTAGHHTMPSGHRTSSQRHPVSFLRSQY